MQVRPRQGLDYGVVIPSRDGFVDGSPIAVESVRDVGLLLPSFHYCQNFSSTSDKSSESLLRLPQISVLKAHCMVVLL
jgi:hypothetical protein